MKTTNLFIDRTDNPDYKQTHKDYPDYKQVSLKTNKVKLLKSFINVDKNIGYDLTQLSVNAYRLSTFYLGDNSSNILGDKPAQTSVTFYKDIHSAIYAFDKLYK